MADNKKNTKVKKPKVIKPFKEKKPCPKCSSRMADHIDRFSCGKCGYTEFKTKK